MTNRDDILIETLTKLGAHIQPDDSGAIQSVKCPGNGPAFAWRCPEIAFDSPEYRLAAGYAKVCVDAYANLVKVGIDDTRTEKWKIDARENAIAAALQLATSARLAIDARLASFDAADASDSAAPLLLSTDVAATQIDIEVRTYTRSLARADFLKLALQVEQGNASSTTLFALGRSPLPWEEPLASVLGPAIVEWKAKQDRSTARLRGSAKIMLGWLRDVTDQIRVCLPTTPKIRAAAAAASR